MLWTLASGDTAKDIAEGEKLLAEGRHRAFKLKIGARELATDLRHTRAIVEALGDRASIRVDVNQCLGTPPPAQKAAANWRRWASILSNSRSAPMIMPPPVRLSQQIETAILADEAVATAYDGYQLAQQGFTGAYALKIAKAGGPNSVLALARVAQAAGIGLYGGTMLEGTVGTVASLHASVDAAAAVGYRDVRPAVAERRYCQRAAHLCRRSGGAAANAGPWRRAG